MGSSLILQQLLPSPLLLSLFPVSVEAISRAIKFPFCSLRPCLYRQSLSRKKELENFGAFFIKLFKIFLSGFTHTDPDHYVRQLMNNAGYCVKMAPPRAFIKNDIIFTKVSYIVAEIPQVLFCARPRAR